MANHALAGTLPDAATSYMAVSWLGTAQGQRSVAISTTRFRPKLSPSLSHHRLSQREQLCIVTGFPRSVTWMVTSRDVLHLGQFI